MFKTIITKGIEAQLLQFKIFGITVYVKKTFETRDFSKEDLKVA